MNLNYVGYAHDSKVLELQTIEAELERIRKVREILVNKEAKLIVKLLRLKKELSR